MDIQLPIQLPSIDLSTVLPLAALVILAVLILLTLTARSIIQSKALAVVALAAVIMGESASIVGGMQAIAVLIGVAGMVTIGLIITLSRNREVLDVVSTIAITRRLPARTDKIDASTRHYQLPAAGHTSAPRSAQRRSSVRIPRGWL